MSGNKKYSGFRSTEFYLLLFLIVVLFFLRIFAPGFFDINNIMSILNRFSYILISAIGMNMIIITSNIDISAGALISVLCIIVALVGKAGVNTMVLFLVAIVCGILISSLNGLIITKLKIPAMVATLAATQILQGILPLSVNGSIYDLPVGFTWLAVKAKIFGVIPGSVLIALIVAAIAIIFMKYSRYSKKLYALGNNMTGARLAGVNVNRVVMISYMIAGGLYGVSAVIIATASQRVTPTMANGMEMLFIASVVLGGTSTTGGRGKIQGTVVGAIILAMISSAINYLGISSDWSDAVMGFIILASVVTTTYKRKKKRIIEGVVYR